VKHLKIYFLTLFLIGGTHFMYGQENNSGGYIPNWKLSLHLSPMLTRLKNNTGSDEEKERCGFSGGAGLTYYFKKIGKMELGVSMGLDYRMYHGKHPLNYNDSVWTTDVDGDRVHVYEQAQMTETQKAAYLAVPLQIHLNYPVSEHWEVYVNAGYSLSFLLSGRYTTHMILSRQGYYPEDNVLVSDVDVEGSQYFYPTDKAMAGDRMLKLKKKHSILGGLGVRYKVNWKFSFFAGVKGNFGLNNISGYKNTGEQTLANSDRSLNTLLSGGDKIRANAAGLEFGISVNLK
jgi:hypothetical protein